MNKLVLITGGTKGIGKALVKKFAANDFDIITCARNASEVARLKDEINSIHPNIEMHAYVADLSKATDRAQFIINALNHNRTLDVLVNNTGTFVQGTIHREPAENLSLMLETNLISAYEITRAFLPAMMVARSGIVFNMCSTASIVPYVNGGSYCISKYALYGMSKVLREEMKPHGVKVTAILPGATYTSSWEGAPFPEERFIKADDIADAIWSVYNLSPHADVEELLIRPQLGDI